MEKAIETPVEGQQAIVHFLMARTVAIPDDVRDRLIKIAVNEVSPVVASVNAAELIYARADELPPELLELGAQLAAMCANFNFHGFLSNDNRGYAIAATLRARPGVSANPPAASQMEAPEPSAIFLPPEEAPEAPETAPDSEEPA